MLADADIEKAVDGAMKAKMRNMGEACTAANRFFVHRSVVEEFGEKFSKKMSELRVGNGALAGTDVGPLIEQKGLEKVESLVADAVSKGARVLTGGSRPEGPGYFYSPHRPGGRTHGRSVDVHGNLRPCSCHYTV